MFSCKTTPYLDKTNDNTDRVWSRILNTKETIQNKTKLPLGNLSEAIERVQKRALNIIYPEAESYAHALQLGKLDRLDDRRVHLCYKYMAKMKSPSQPLRHLLPRPLLDAPDYTLRQKTKSIIFSGTCRSVEQREWRTSLLLNILSDSIVIII